MKKLKEHLASNYYDLHREWHYKDIEPRVFAEELLGVDNSKEYTAPLDYKVHCLGDHLFMQVDTDRFTNHSRACFDENWNLLPFSLGYPLPKKEIEKPEKLSEMLSMARVLSKGLGTLRVDLYQIDGRLFAGELTFTHECGGKKFDPNEWDKKWGELWQ